MVRVIIWVVSSIAAHRSSGTFTVESLRLKVSSERVTTEAWSTAFSIIFTESTTRELEASPLMRSVCAEMTVRRLRKS